MTGAEDDPPPFSTFGVESTQEIYSSPFCRLRCDQVRLPGGELRSYDVFDVDPSVVVVPVLPDGGIVFLWQYRYPHGRTHWELPAGHIDPGEEPHVAAGRELLEETGYRAGELARVAGFYPINGISPHYAHIFIATDCVHEREATHDASEVMSVHVASEAEARRRLLAGELEDGFSALALAYHFLRRPR